MMFGFQQKLETRGRKRRKYKQERSVANMVSRGKLVVRTLTMFIF